MVLSHSIFRLMFIIPTFNITCTFPFSYAPQSMNVKKTQTVVLRHALIQRLAMSALVVLATAWQMIDIDVMVCNYA